MSILILSLAIPDSLAATTVNSLGNTSPGFNDGDTPSILQLINAQSGQPAPFNAAIGNDLFSNFFASWVHSYGALSETITSASITVAMAAHDSAQSGDQVASFTLDGVNLVGLLNTEFNGRGGAVNEYNVYTIALPGSTFSALADGSATLSLVLQGPGAAGSFNGAHIIFSTLSIETQPTDMTAPTAVCDNVNLQLDSNGQASITPEDVDGGSSDNVGIASLSISQSSFSCGDLGSNTVTLTVTDTSGNTSTCEATVTVEDPSDACSANNQGIGGEIIPIESTSLILAGAQSFSWMIPVVLSVIGIGLVLVRKK